MTAIVTQQFRLNAAKKFIQDIGNSYPEYDFAAPNNANSYYLFISRSEEWGNAQLPDDPYDNTYSAFTDAWQRMTAMKLINAADTTYATYRHQWISGSTYDEYDDRDPDLEGKPYFVITDSNNVYICLRSGGVSTINPENAITTSSATALADGYVWKYMFTLTQEASNKFLTSAFIPVTYLESNPGAEAATALQDQWNSQQAAVDGAIYAIKVIDGGQNYSNPIVTVTGDGSGLVVNSNDITVVDGIITEILIDPQAGVGSGYNVCSITIEDTGGGVGSGATARAVIGPPGGFGADPRVDLRAHYATINVNLIYDDGDGDFITNNSFRQIGIIRNPIDVATGLIAVAPTLSATKSFVIDDTYPLSPGDVIIGGTTGAQAIVDSYVVDVSNALVRYHQTDETGYKDFDGGVFEVSDGESIQIVGDVTSTPIIGGSMLDAEVVPFTGDIVFLENRTAISRAADQIETIKLVLEF